MVAFAIDSIPSLVDDQPYASYTVSEWVPDVCLAGFGPTSDGVPVTIGGSDASDLRPKPPRTSKPMHDIDRTVRIRKP